LFSHSKSKISHFEFLGPHSEIWILSHWHIHSCITFSFAYFCLLFLHYPLWLEKKWNRNCLWQKYYYLFVVYSAYIASNEGVIDIWMMNWKEFGRKQSWPDFKVLFQHLTGDWGKPWQTSG
jgi:hypothetical protein